MICSERRTFFGFWWTKQKTHWFLQVSGSIGYFGSDLLFTGTIQTATQVWGFDQFLDLLRYTGQEYLWQKFGPRKLGISEAVAFPGSGIDG